MSQAPSLLAAAQAATAHFSAERTGALLRQPTIIVSAPRSGSNLLFERMSQIRGFWTIGAESHAIFAAFPHLYAENANLDSGSLHRSHANEGTCRGVRACFLFLMRNHRGVPYIRIPAAQQPPEVCLLEKTPRNALNIPFLLEVFPGARFIFLHRDARENVASIIEAWEVGLKTGRFVTFRNLPEWDRPAWCFLLPPGWRSMVGKSLPEIAAFQWSASNNIILDHLTHLPTTRWLSVDYAQLVAAPGETLRRLCHFAGVDVTENDLPAAPLPLSRTTLTAPHPHKWKRHEQAIRGFAPALEVTEERVRRALTPAFPDARTR
jgi:hypothetical protein